MQTERDARLLGWLLWLGLLASCGCQPTEVGPLQADGTCPPGSYKSDASCMACPSQCTRCSTSYFCDECRPSYFLSSRRCQTCGYRCEACESFFKCLRCSSGFELTDQSLCEQSIPAKPGLSDAGLAGVVLGSVLCFGILVCVVYCVVKKRARVAQASEQPGALGADSQVQPSSNTRRALDSERGESSVRPKKHRTQAPSSVSQLDAQQTQPQTKRSGTTFGTLPPISQKRHTLRY